MSNSQKQWGAIIVMIALFAMIAFVTNLCTDGNHHQNQGESQTYRSDWYMVTCSFW